uniref:Uncharacterized protein n=1 Tax=Glossina brevipalpis TaxID=37001 RepID=A0A1A9X458_9MUSC
MRISAQADEEDDAALFHGGLILLLLAIVTVFAALVLLIVRKLRYFCVRSNVERGTDMPPLEAGECRPPSEFLSPSLCKRVRVRVPVVVVVVMIVFFLLSTGDGVFFNERLAATDSRVFIFDTLSILVCILPLVIDRLAAAAAAAAAAACSS